MARKSMVQTWPQLNQTTKWNSNLTAIESVPRQAYWNRAILFGSFFFYMLLEKHIWIYTRNNNGLSYQVLCLTLLPLKSPPSESWAHTLRDFDPLTLTSPHCCASVFKSSDWSEGLLSFKCSKPFDCITAAQEWSNLQNHTKHVKTTLKFVELTNSRVYDEETSQGEFEMTFETVKDVFSLLVNF